MAVVTAHDERPATGELVGSVPDAGEADVVAAIDAAAAAFDAWKSLAAVERARLLRRAADAVRERKGDIASVMFHGVIAAVTPTG